MILDTDSTPPGWRLSTFGREMLVRGGLVDPRDPVWSGTVLIAPNHIESGTGRVLARETAAEQGADSGKYVVRAGDLIYSKIRPALNKVAVATEDCLCSADMYPVVPAKEADVRFCQYYMLADPFLTYAALAADRVKMPKVNREELSGAPWLVPALAEQRRIADYLDRETDTIDALIEKQRQLIEGLRERGDASWRRLYDSVLKTVRPLPLRRHVQSISDGPFGSALTSAHYAASGVRVIRLGNIGPGVFKLDDEAFISHEYGEKLKRYAVSPGDLIMAGLGDSNVSLGRTAEVPEGLGPAINKADCFRLRLHAGVDSRYMVVALNAPQTRELVLQLAQGSTRQRMNTSVAARLPVAVPDPRCQAQVVEQWESETAKIDALIAKAERFIELAQERRAALITAAVTGQIEIPTED